MSKLKEAKQLLRECKSAAVAAKKQVNPALKAFAEAPMDTELAKAYRNAVSDHVKTARRLFKAAQRVSTLTAE